MWQVQTPEMVYGVFSFDDGLGIGVDDETNVSLDYKEGDNAFTGKISKVTISVKWHQDSCSRQLLS